MDDKEAHEFYSDPANLVPAGPGHKRSRPMMSGLIPVRFTPEMIAAVKRVATEDGMTVSAWIRRVVDRERAAREGRCPTCGQGATFTDLPD